MKCPICDIELGNHTDLCPFCRTPLKLGEDGKLYEDLDRAKEGYQGKYAKLDPNKETYDFDLQYTLTFKDADEIRKAVADLEVGLGPEPVKEETRAETPEEQKIRELEQRRLERKMQRSGQKKKSSKAAGTAAHKPARKDRAPHEDTPQQKKTKRGILIGSLAAVVVIALIFGAINLFASMMNKEVEIPTVYLKDNALFMYYGGKAMQLSENMVVPGTAEPEPTTTPKPSDSSSSSNKNKNDQKDNEAQPAITLTEKDLVKISPDGTVTYYFENFNMASRSGDLVAVTSGKKGSKQTIAANVFYDLVLSKDGKSLLFLSEATPYGENGRLFYWTQKMDAPQQLEEGVLKQNFKFAQDGKSVLYISGYNPEYHVGNLMVRSLAKGVGDGQQVDSDVAAVFGTNPTGTIRVYAKNYNKEDGTFDVYSVKDNSSPAQLTTKSGKEPVFLEKSDWIYAYDTFESDAHTLASINLENGEKKNLTTEVTEIVQVSKDESAVAFTKEYDNEGKRLIDYYYVGSDGIPPQKIANNVGIFEDDQHARIVQFDISDDFSRVAYIAGFNPDEERGALYTESIINGVVGTEKRISDNAYSCNVSADGAVVRYADSYNKDGNSVDILAYSNSNTQTLAQGVGSSSFTFDRNGEYTVYARNYDAQTRSGALETVDKKAKMTAIMTEVNAYGLKDNGETIFFKNLNQETNQIDLYYASQKGDKTTAMDTGVTKVLVY